MDERQSPQHVCKITPGPNARETLDREDSYGPSLIACEHSSGDLAGWVDAGGESQLSW